MSIDSYGQFGRAMNLTVSVVSPTGKNPPIIKWLIVGFAILVMLVLGLLVNGLFTLMVGPTAFGLGIITALS